ncbi:unnamed protein product [Caenorhabditis auriculariae]|uniref:Calcineurin-like phosphoesterase domain-containing protein n=1 Tax=Caenorhabditis auriculariae TaxID=2777116 RepID=A0A8S1H386_9PELO|nr:unnamed protein product [Caenorhabditis auriculariae]
MPRRGLGDQLRRVFCTYWPFFLILNVLMFNEFLVYFIVIGTSCQWPCRNHRCNGSDLHAFMISDTHLLGKSKGHWFDKLKREWQMYRSYQTAVTLLDPDAVFFLGDLMDEGQWTDEKLFHEYSDHFRSLFGSNGKRPQIHALAGNHDLGFHYAINPSRVDWFSKEFNRSVVDLVRIKGQPFVLITSMALHGDGCRLCGEAEKKIEQLSQKFDDASRGKPKRRPIILQHFPLFRNSDADCIPDASEENEDDEEVYRELWEALSEAATLKLLAQLRPAAVFNGHTHKGCRKRWSHPHSFWEYTVNSFSWRNGDRPSFLMAVISENEVRVEACRLPRESTLIWIYAISGAILKQFRNRFNPKIACT